MFKKIKFSILFILSCLLLPTVSIDAGEPQRPDVQMYFDFAKEAKINEIMNLKSHESFEKLRSIEFFMNDDLLHKAIFKAFNHRSKEAIDLAVSHLKSPDTSFKGAGEQRRVSSYYVAKKILEVFPEDSVSKLLTLYKEGDAVTRGNVIRVSGKIAGGQEIRNLLISALDDKAFCEPDDPELDGKPLRVCDVAYNQLVLRYQIRNVLRTIGNGYKTEIRDYHINILKQRI